MSQTANDDIRTAVRETYSQIAVSDAGGCCAPSASSCCAPETPVQIGSTQLGYSEADLTSVPDGADLGLGCGNPRRHRRAEAGRDRARPGQRRAASTASSPPAPSGPSGRVIGVDMTPEMVSKARANAEKRRLRQRRVPPRRDRAPARGRRDRRRDHLQLRHQPVARQGAGVPRGVPRAPARRPAGDLRRRRHRRTARRGARATWPLHRLHRRGLTDRRAGRHDGRGRLRRHPHRAQG